MSLKFQKSIVNSNRWKPPINREKAIKLDLNESYGLFDDKFLKKLSKIDNFIVSCYPEYDKLIGLISGYVQQPSCNIVITNGADQAIDLVLRLFFDKKNSIVIPSPVFFRYDNIFNILGVNAKHVFYKEGKDDFIFPIEEVLEELEQSDGIVLCNPNNPLGSSIDGKDLIRILKRSKELNIPCIIDEAYFEFYNKTSVPLIKKFDNLIIIRTFSKMFGLAGLRLGYVVANEGITKQLIKIRGPWDVNHFTVKAGEIALQNIKYFQGKLQGMLKIKKELFNFLKKRHFKVYNTSTNFILVRHNKSDNLLKELRKKRILINNVSDYPFSNNILKDVLRVTLPSSNDFKFLKYFFRNYKD